MPYALAEAQWRILRRGVGRAAAGNPVIAIGLFVVLLVTPLLAVLAGRASGRTLGASLSSVDVAQSLSVTVAFIAVLAGALLALLVPGEKALGEQLAAAPLTRAQVFWGLTAIPVLCVLAVLVLLAALFELPFAAAGPGGRLAGIATLSLAASGLTIGAVLVQGITAARRGAASGLAALAAVGIVWPLCGTLAGGPVSLGVFAWLPQVLSGRQTAGTATLSGVALAAAFATTWVMLCLRTPLEGPPRRPATRRPLMPKRFFGAVLALGLLRIARRRELRNQALLVTAATIGGALLLYSVVPTSLGFIFVFCASTAILGAAISPLAVAGLDARGRWLWHTIPASRCRRAATSHAAALFAGGAILLVACAPVAIVARVDLHAVTDLVVLAAVVFAAALVAGALLPWQEATSGEQVASYAIFMVIAGLGWTALGWIARQAIGHGLPQTAITAVLPTLAICAGVALSARLVTREST